MNNLSKDDLKAFLTKYGKLYEKSIDSRSDNMYITMPSSVKHAWATCVVDSLDLFVSKNLDYYGKEGEGDSLVLRYSPTMNQAIEVDGKIPFIIRGRSFLDLDNDLLRDNRYYPYGVYMNKSIIVMSDNIQLNEFEIIGVNFIKKGINNLYVAGLIKKTPSIEEIELCLAALKYWHDENKSKTIIA